jgi:hypothetical protein
MSYNQNSKQSMGGLKPLDVETLRVRAEQLSLSAKKPQTQNNIDLPHIIEGRSIKAIEAYKTLGDHYVSIGDAKNAGKMYKSMKAEQNALKKFLRTSKPGTSGHVPSGN